MRMPTALLAIALATTGIARTETLLVANKSDDTVDLIDLATGSSWATLPTGHAPHEIAVSADGGRAVITNYGDRQQPGNSLTVLDLTVPTVARTIDLGEHTRPHGVTFLDEDHVVVTTEGSAHLLTVDVTRGRVVQSVATEAEVSHMLATSARGDRAFVANIGSGSVTVVDLAAGRKLLDLATGEGAEGIATRPDGGEIWVGNRAADTLSIIDPESLQIQAELPCPGFPIRVAFTPDGSRALISAASTGEVVLFDVSQRRELTRTSLDLSNAPDASRRLFGDRFGESPVPVGLVVSPDGDVAWVAATQADVVVVVNPETLQVVDLLRAGHEPDGMAYSPVAPPRAATTDPGHRLRAPTRSARR